jgi:beta-glucanase (GH16 family)
MKITGNGSWGWGNGELEFYKEENVEIVEVPGDPGNNALHITAKQESGPDIVDQWGNPLNYTSGKVTTKAKVSVQYGVIETRVRVPDLDLGGWPAVWLLGTSNLNWPSCGELDMMEMGSRQAFRDLHDEHNGGNGSNNSTVNQVVGANAIFYADEAVVPENPSGAASISWDPDDDYCRPYYNYDNLNDRFLTYRIYWDPDSIRFTVIDDSVEYDLYTDPFPIDSVSAEFQQPFYLIANLAIGGAFTDAVYIGGSGLPISMPFPAHMYVDYIKVMEWNGQGEVHIGPPTFQGGTFGLFTDTTPIDNGLVAGDDAEIYVWEGTLSEGSIPPYEGENGISWQSTGLGWFGAGIMSMQPVNLFNFEEGHLKFMINIPANISFKIGIIDAWGNQSYVDFPANQTTYGLVRNGNWGQASIPVADIRGEFIDLRMLSYEFVILEVNGASCEFGLDDIYWDGGGGAGSVTVDHSEGWNLVGLPLEVESSAYQDLFPESVNGSLYGFDETYYNEDDLVSGSGYWLNFFGDGSSYIQGEPFTELDIGLSQGWNLISGISVVTSVDDISDLDGIVVPGTVYDFAGTYTNASLLTPGHGYWVNASADGDITISSGGAAKTISAFTDHTVKANKLSFNGNNLYFGVSVSEEEMPSYELPPKPPAGVFDVRFNDGWRLVKDYGEVELINTSETITIAYDIKIEAGEHMNWVLTSGTGKEYILEGADEITIPSSERFFLKREPVIPITFALHQNHPNPFNPITSLRYDLPEQAQVTLTVYDLMGREVTQLVNTTQEAGYRTVQWTSTDMHGKPVSAGVYLYQVQAGKFVRTKKMVLLK